MSADAVPRRMRLWRLVPVAALLCFALVLRAPITVISPLLGPIRADLGIDAATAGLLTSIPVLCFGLLTPVASRILSAIGVNLGGVSCLVGIIVGSVVRSAGDVTAAFAGTAVLGVSMAMGNLAIPMLIGRQFRHRAEMLTGAYVITTNLTVTATTALAVPELATDEHGDREVAHRHRDAEQDRTGERCGDVPGRADHRSDDDPHQAVDAAEVDADRAQDPRRDRREQSEAQHGDAGEEAGGRGIDAEIGPDRTEQRRN